MIYAGHVSARRVVCGNEQVAQGREIRMRDVHGLWQQDGVVS